jgi:hypothetical protein
MSRLDDDSDAAGIKNFGQSMSNLFGKTFLELKAARKHFGNSRELGETNYALFRDIANVHLEASVNRFSRHEPSIN